MTPSLPLSLALLCAAPSPPATHQAAELLAKDHVYAYGRGVEGGMATDAKGRGAIEFAGFKVKAALDDTSFSVKRGQASEQQSGFAAMAVEGPGNTVYIVFRGTDDLKDTADYLGTNSGKGTMNAGGAEVAVGREQYARYKKALDELAERFKNTGKHVVVTGHSLGGALAQRFVADHPDLVNELVLFQSPGVEHDVWKKMLAWKNKGGRVPDSTLYVAEWDKVSDFGYAHLGDPKVVVGAFEGQGKRNFVAAHSGFFVLPPDKKSRTGCECTYGSFGKLKGLKRVSYRSYSRERAAGGDLSALEDESSPRSRYKDGTYRLKANGYDIALTLAFHGDAFDGKDDAQQAISGGSISGDAIRFTRACPGFTPPTQTYTGSISGGTASGTFTGAGGAPGQSYPWSLELGPPQK